MKWFLKIGALCALVLAAIPANAMTLGARPLLHGHAAARQVAEAEMAMQTWVVTFDANGGTIDTGDGSIGATLDISVTNDCAIGTLPVASRLDYIFEGWFPLSDGGEQVTSEAVITSDVTLYAHWRCRFEFGDGDAWTQQSDGSWKSDVTADGATNSLSMTVNGAGTVSFRCKTSCEDYFNFKGTLIRQDGLSFIVDGEEMVFANGIMNGWSECAIEVEGEGSHTLSWEYIKDASGFEGEDCAWVADVTWAPADVVVEIGGGKVVCVPGGWLAEYTLRAATDTAANGRKVWECYVLGLDPEDVTNDFRIVSFPMKADGTPDFDAITISPPQTQWNVQGATPVLKGKATLEGTGEWQSVTDENKADMRFFKVEVVLP